MVRYYKLFDLLNRRNMKKSDLRQILSPKTVAKLSKGEYLSGEAIEKICLFLGCQPGDIMEIVESESLDENGRNLLTEKTILKYKNESITETYYETIPQNMDINQADETMTTSRNFIKSEDM